MSGTRARPSTATARASSKPRLLALQENARRRSPARRTGGDCAISGLGERATGAGDPGEAEGDRAAQRAETGHHPPRRHARPRPLRPSQTLRHPLARRHSAALGTAAHQVALLALAMDRRHLAPSRPLEWRNISVAQCSQANRRFINSADQFVTPTALRECHLPKVPAGSVLVANTGQGRSAELSAVLGIEATINQHIAFITPRVANRIG